MLGSSLEYRNTIQLLLNPLHAFFGSCLTLLGVVGIFHPTFSLNVEAFDLDLLELSIWLYLGGSCCNGGFLL